MHVGLMKAHSTGRIELRDSDPSSPPTILVNYLQAGTAAQSANEPNQLTAKLAYKPNSYQTTSHLSADQLATNQPTVRAMQTS
jgi:hypothetical protein